MWRNYPIRSNDFRDVYFEEQEGLMND
jgi:hypothetical protein